jgi:hypothetical protein
LLGGQFGAGQIVQVSADGDAMKFTLDREVTEAAASEAAG